MSASVRVTSRTDNVAGVKLPVFNQYDTGARSEENLGLVGGGRKILNCKEKFGDYLRALVKIASLQTSFLAMDEALKITNRRVNALENVTIPKILGTIDYINRELDELEREDFTRLKMVKKKKEEQIKAEELAASEREAAEEGKQASTPVAAPSKSAPPIPPSTASASGESASNDKKKSKKDKKKKDKEAAAESAAALPGFEEGEDDDVVFK